MVREWKLVGGPITQWRGTAPDGTTIFLETANYWLYLNGACYVGPFTSEKAVRSAAAQKLGNERRLIGTLRQAKEVLHLNYTPAQPEIDPTTLEEKDLP